MFNRPIETLRKPNTTEENTMEQTTSEGRDKTEMLDARLKEWGIDLEILRTRATKASGAAKARLESEVAKLQTKLNSGRQQLDEFKKSGKSASGELKKGVERAWASLEEAFEKAKEKFE